MKHLVALALAMAGCASPPPPGGAPAPAGSPAASDADPLRPAAIAAERVPRVPPEVRARLAQYQNARGAAFQDFGPDGSILVATRFADTPQLHAVPFPGGRREQLTFSDEPVSDGVWVPGTADVLYTQSRGGDENYQIYRLDRKRGRSVLLTDGASRHVRGPLSRSGDRLVFSSNRRNGRDMDLYLLDLRTGTSELLLQVSGEFWSAADWSPDDAKLLLLRLVSVSESHPFVLDLATRERRPLAPPGTKAAHAPLRFSSDGRSVLVASDAAGEFRQLARVETDAAGYGWITKSIPWDVEDLEVSGALAAFVVNEDGASRLYLLKDGAFMPVNLPLGILSGLRFSPDGGRLGFTLARADGPADAYTYEIAAGKLVRWTFSETGGLDASTFVTPERITYPSFDGRAIPAYLYAPRAAPGRKAPVVISIHGGPESQYRPFFSGVTQYWVSELGLAVLAPNVRGSTGYGKTYVSLDNAERREDAVRDIGALLDWIAKQPNLDASRVAVHGGSYGGFMVLASLVRFGDRIRAGVDVVGIGNWVTFLEKTSAYRVDLRRVEYGDERKPEMRAFLERISPANHADRIRSALLVAHGRNDPRVPFFEAEQIAGRVRAGGGSVWTVYAANEGHGFARKENRDYLTAVTTLFFQKYLFE
jgi:dipeptidyl aminopeptidase/acylaminoacyl peptidase